MTSANHWPARFTIGYLASRAGMTRRQMKAQLLRTAYFARLMEEHRKRKKSGKRYEWFWITLADLRRMDERLYESVQLREAMIDEQEEQEEEAA